jgi:hypothetical protein
LARRRRQSTNRLSDTLRETLRALGNAARWYRVDRERGRRQIAYGAERVARGFVIPENDTGSMATETTDQIRCNTCDTTFSASSAADMQAHQGHDTEHVEPGG